MTIGEAFIQFRSEFHWGNVCHAIGNFFQNVKSSLGDKGTSNAMGSASPCNETPVSRDAQLTEIFGVEHESVNAFGSSKHESWCDAHNREIEDLKGQFESSMKTFFEGPIPTLKQTHDLNDMTLAEARELLGVKDGEETRLDANERGRMLRAEIDKIHFATRDPSSDQSLKSTYMRQKIEKAVALVEGFGLNLIPEPKIT
jgi:hypothetical protein